MYINNRLAFWLTSSIFAVFFIFKAMLLFGFWLVSPVTHMVEFGCLLSLVPLFWSMVYDYRMFVQGVIDTNTYGQDLRSVLIDQSRNALYYKDDIELGAKDLTKRVTQSLKADSCSIWLFNEDKSSLDVEQIYYAATDSWKDHFTFSRAGHETYFNALDGNRVIVANDVFQNEITLTISDTLNELGVKSLLEVPIVYDETTIGVIKIASYQYRVWNEREVDFAILLSSLYTFAYSVKDGFAQESRVKDIEKFIDKATLVSRTDINGNILYVNKRFEEISGYKSKDLIGQKHKILSSGIHPKEFWVDMFKKCKEKRIWNNIVINRTKKGQLFYTETYIKGVYDDDGELIGYMSIRHDITDVVKSAQEINQKNVYLEYASKIIRHDMHSGINTYIPRGVSSLRRRLTDDVIREYKLESPLRMLEEGLAHTQKVYKGVYEFTNLVKKNVLLNKSKCDLKKILQSFLADTSYGNQVIIEDLATVDVNEALFCTAVDNLIRNGLKYNDSPTKFVRIFMDSKNVLAVQDNGRGMTQAEFNELDKGYTRKLNQREGGTGLGLNICVAILNEHKFTITCEKNNIGTKFKIKM